MKKKQILIVEDDINLNKGLAKALSNEERTAISCGTIREAREQLLVSTPSIAVVDVNLPDGSGLDFLKTLQEEGRSFPVVILTANDTDMDIVEGLNSGADDYVTKPFSLAVLRARIDRLLRREEEDSVKKSTLYESGIYDFDFDSMIFLVDGEKRELSKTEQKLLRILTANAGNTVSRERLSEYVWSDGTDYIDENALSVTIKRLRDKLMNTGKIKTVYGIGYKWDE